MEIVLKLGDAFKLIKEIPDNSIDLIFTDPPYDGTKHMDELTDKQKEEMAKEFYRVLKPTGNLALFCGYEDKWKWYNILTRLGFKFRREIIWVYPNPTGSLFAAAQGKLKNFVAAHETCLFFSKTDNYYFNNEGMVEKDWFEHPAFGGIMRIMGYENTPKEKIGVTPKPIALAKIIVKRLCPKGGVVLDPFMGTGTFGIAAQWYGCKFIGFEINEKIFEFAKKRLNNLSSIIKEENLLNFY